MPRVPRPAQSSVVPDGARSTAPASWGLRAGPGDLCRILTVHTLVSQPLRAPGRGGSGLSWVGALCRGWLGGGAFISLSPQGLAKKEPERWRLSPVSLSREIRG